MMNLSWKLLGRGLVGAGVALAGFVLVGCETTSPSPDFPGDGAAYGNPHLPDGGDTLILRPGESVRVEFSGLPHVKPPHEEQIQQDGTLTLAHIGSIQAAGKTPGQLQNDIRDAYVPRFYRSLNVVVRAADRFYIVGGEVRTPNRHVYLGPTTVVTAIKSAGDFTDFARKTRVRVTRTNGKVETINVNKAMEDPKYDLPIYPGDIIHVPRRFFRE